MATAENEQDSFDRQPIVNVKISYGDLAGRILWVNETGPQDEESLACLHTGMRRRK
jgi:hypothetical protein